MAAIRSTPEVAGVFRLRQPTVNLVSARNNEGVLVATSYGGQLSLNA